MTDMHDSAGLYVLNALSDEDLVEFERHVAGCGRCQEEVAQMRETAVDLARAAAADPPPTLRRRVLDAVDDVRQEPVADVELHSNEGAKWVDSPPMPTAYPKPPSVNTEVISLSDRQRRRARLSYLVAAAAVVLALVAGGWAVNSRQDADQSADRQAQLISLLGASDVRAVSQPMAGGGSGTLVLSDSSQRAVFVGAQLPALPQGKTYQLWTITTQPSSAGLVSSGNVLVNLPDAALSADELAITVEPSGGSDQPTSRPILALHVPKTS